MDDLNIFLVNDEPTPSGSQPRDALEILASGDGLCDWTSPAHTDLNISLVNDEPTLSGSQPRDALEILASEDGLCDWTSPAHTVMQGSYPKGSHPKDLHPNPTTVNPQDDQIEAVQMKNTK